MCSHILIILCSLQSQLLSSKLHLLSVLHRLNQVNLRLKPGSLRVGYSQLVCLGYLLSIHGIGIDPSKVATITDWPLPSTGYELQQFLGTVVFVSHHVRHFAHISAELQAAKNLAKIEWTEKLLYDFNLVKTAVASAPFLQFPDYTLPFHIATDASVTGVGGVLYQPHVKGEKITPNNIVALCSKKSTLSQRNYPPFKKELFGIVYCLRQFHGIYLGSH